MLIKAVYEVKVYILYSIIARRKSAATYGTLYLVSAIRAGGTFYKYSPATTLRTATSVYIALAFLLYCTLYVPFGVSLLFDRQAFFLNQVDRTFSRFPFQYDFTLNRSLSEFLFR